MTKACPAPARMLASDMRALVTCALALTASAASAQELMTAEEFDAWSSGHTLDYFAEGTYWGSEAHFPGHATTDQVDDECRNGSWAPQDGAICFEYDAEGPFCWYFWRDGDIVTAKTTDAGPEVAPYTVTLSDTPLNCPGPDVGV